MSITSLPSRTRYPQHHPLTNPPHPPTHSLTFFFNQSPKSNFRLHEELSSMRPTFDRDQYLILQAVYSLHRHTRVSGENLHTPLRMRQHLPSSSSPPKPFLLVTLSNESKLPSRGARSGCLLIVHVGCVKAGVLAPNKLPTGGDYSWLSLTSPQPPRPSP